MRNAVAGLLIGATLVLCVSSSLPWWNPVHGQLSERGGGVAAGGELTGLTWETATAQQLAVLDPRMRVLSVYEINKTTGAITLRSVRNIGWDLQMEEFNSTNPSPREIRAILERR